MKIKIILLPVASALILSSCINLDKKLYGNYEKMRKDYTPHLHKNITNFSDGLTCMDQLLMSRNVRYTSVLIESLNDNTNQVKAGTRDMLISAISEMTTRSKKVKIIAYGKDSANLISFLKTAQKGDVYKNIPQYDIRGSISQYDKDVVQTDTSLGLFGRGTGGLGKTKAASLDVMTLDLSAVDTRDMSVVHGVTSKNTIAIYSKGNSLDADARIDKLGVYFDMTLSRSEGKSQALRNLMELASIEIIGKLTKVPYWTCLGTKSPSEILKDKSKKKAVIKKEKELPNKPKKVAPKPKTSTKEKAKEVVKKAKEKIEWEWDQL